MGQSSGWFLLRQIHRRFPGQLRPTFFTVFGIGKFAASALASRMPHSVCTWLRQLRAASFTGQASVMRLWHHRPSVWRSKQAAMARRVILGPCCLTTHSSRRRSAARLNSGVRPQWIKLGGGSCFGSFPTVCPSAPGAAFHCSRHRQIRGFGLGLSVLCTRRFASFGDSARPGLPGKPRLAGCGIIGLRCVFQAAALAFGKLLGHCCLTTHSSRRGYRHAA